ncbi:hypothetical protein BASA81_002714 [Batrachochytrium salamandrivorans]|nr:hypothetical protein BASA81_002714 [Batrachochytrium salamandrivorans]
MGRRRGPKAKSSPLSAPLPPLLEASTLGGGGGEEGEEEEEEASEVWKPYQCKSIAFGEKHPGSLVEGAALAAIELPPNSYPLQDSLGFQIQTGRLSSMQLEGVMYACERHSRKLPGGARAGFLLNDSAGVGKGRQVAGIIVDNLVRARPRHVWFSVSKDLHLDASRDFQDLGCTVQVIPSVAKLTTTKTDSNGSVVFCTYTELISKGRAKSNDTRYDELVDWLCGGKTPELRENFDGCLIFDESHKAKNVVEGKKESTAVSSKTGELVVRIQTDLPNARVVYSSATGIIGIESMGYLVRMGLWGVKIHHFERLETFGIVLGVAKGMQDLVHWKCLL